MSDYFTNPNNRTLLKELSDFEDEIGIKMLTGAYIRTMKWKAQTGKCDFSSNSDFLNPRTLQNLHKELKVICGKPKFIKITPELPPMCCHNNAEFISKKKGYEVVRGWNITSCPCHANVICEFHSINKNDKGQLVDYTTDFDDLKVKAFIPIKKKMTLRVFSKGMPKDVLYFQPIIGKKCRCRMVGPPTANNPLNSKKVIKTIQGWR